MVGERTGNGKVFPWKLEKMHVHRPRVAHMAVAGYEDVLPYGQPGRSGLRQACAAPHKTGLEIKTRLARSQRSVLGPPHALPVPSTKPNTWSSLPPRIRLLPARRPRTFLHASLVARPSSIVGRRNAIPNAIRSANGNAGRRLVWASSVRLLKGWTRGKYL